MKKYLIVSACTIFGFGIAFFYDKNIKQDDCDEVKNSKQPQLTQYEYSVSDKKNEIIVENYNDSALFFIITDKHPNVKIADGKYFLIDIDGEILKDEINISKKIKFIDILLKLEDENSNLTLKFNENKNDIMQIKDKETILKIPVRKLKNGDNIIIENNLGVKFFDKKVIIKSTN